MAGLNFALLFTMERALLQTLRLIRAKSLQRYTKSPFVVHTCACRVRLFTSASFRFNSTSAIQPQNTAKEANITEKIHWYRMEDDDVINARYAQELLNASVENTEKKTVDMHDVKIHGEVLLEHEHSVEEDFTNPGFAMSYNLAAYVDRSATLQKLVDLGVDLSEVESRPGQADVLVKLDFEKDVAPRIRCVNISELKGIAIEEK